MINATTKMKPRMKERIAWAIMYRDLIWEGYDDLSPEEMYSLMQTNWHTNGEVYLSYAEAALETLITAAKKDTADCSADASMWLEHLP